MRKLIFSVMLIVSSLAYAAQVQIAISTDHTDMVLATNKANQLMFMYYGTKVGCPQQFEQFQSYRRSDYSTEPLAYPARGGRFFNQPALAVKYSDGDANTELTYSSHETKNISSDVKQTTVLLSDTKTSLEVQLVYTAYLKEDVIMAHAVITNKGKKDITLENYASSAINLKAGSYLLTHYYGSWAREMQVEHELLTHGIKTIENKMGVRTTHTENPSFMLSLDNSSLDENHGEVIAGALAWSGNYKLQFQMDETDRLSVICGINDYDSA